LFKGRTSPRPLARFRYNCEGNGWAFQSQKHSRDVFRLQARDGRPIYQQQSVAWENFSTGAAQSVRIGGCGHVCVNGYASHNRSIPLATRPMTLTARNSPRKKGTCNVHTIAVPFKRYSNIIYLPCKPRCHEPSFTKSSRFTRSSNICGVPNIQQTQHSPHPDLS
jgi:hypothetical protein